MKRTLLFCSKRSVSVNIKTIDGVAAVLLALCPILQHYKGIVYNAALTVMVVVALYLMFRLFCKRKELSLSAIKGVLPLVIYLIYRVIDHGTSVTEIGQSGVLIICFLAAAMTCIDIKCMCRAAQAVAVLASVLLLIQYIGFYIFKTHIQLVPTGWLLPSAEQWILGAQTGLAGITGKINDFYRPSAFFLEPSHVYIYMFPHLLVLLFSEKNKVNLYTAIIITMGLILCTSGMGIAAAAGAWVLYFAFGSKDGTFKLKNLLQKRNLIMMGAIVVVIVAAIIFVPTVNRTVMRIFRTGTGVTAIGGRVTKALRGLEDLTFIQWIIGVEDTTHDISYNMPGLIASIYRHGLIGAILSIEIYVRGVFKLRLPYALVCMGVLVTSLFSAHTHSTVGMMYFVLIVILGYQSQKHNNCFFKDLLLRIKKTGSTDKQQQQ